MTLQVVLVEPEIPQNTGNIARLTAANKCILHLIEPLGFSLDDKYLKRAGLDYWPEVTFKLHSSWKAFLETENPQSYFALTTKSTESFWKADFKEGDYLVFGCETRGLPAEIRESESARRYRIDMENQNVRSLNLANAVSIVLYEAKRQIKHSDEPE